MILIKMSNQATKHGSCNAIFSNLPINFNKENKSPANVRSECISYSDLTQNSVRMDKPTKLIKSKSPSAETINVKKTNGISQGKLTKSPGLTNSDRSKSMTTLRKQEAQLSKKFVSDEKLTTPSRPRQTPPVPTDRTPVAQFCPVRSSTNAKSESTPFRSPVKRFFSDHTISQSTPDCFGSVQFETPRGKSDVAVNNEATIYEGENSNLTVGIRIRPMNFRELNDPKILSVVKVRGTDIIVDCESTQHTFHYDHCYVSYTDTSRPTHASQKTVFDDMVLPLVHNAFEGYNVCLFAYGQTGSGKSYSMMGSESNTSTSSVPCGDSGIIPRFCYEIFSQAALNNNITTVEISYFEIYNEKIHDLLGNSSNISGSKRAPLKVREHPVSGPHVVDLSQHVVQNYEDLQIWLKVGNSQRATAATGMNEKSSRSHSIFSIILTQEQYDSTTGKSVKLIDASRRSKINLVDLAGSERLSQTCASGERLREGVSINKSLLILGKVIASLAESTNNRKRGFVPYRESVLTWLLKESLGGNSKTAMLATVSPSSVHLEETLATLRYACQARSIVNRVRINEDPHDKLIRELKAEVLKLRGAREGYERQLGPRRLLDSAETSKNKRDIQKKQREIDKLKEQLRKTEEQLSRNQKSREEKLQVAEQCKSTELNFLRRCGIAIEIDFSDKYSTPCLVNLAADPMLSGTLLYLIPPGIVRIGKHKRQSKPVDILLDGPLVAPLHCTLRNEDGILSLMPEGNGDTYVNGQMVCEKVFLKHGDRLIIGGNHYFKVCNPYDERSNDQVTSQPIDYEYAHQEILAIQEEKLRAELEESKQKAIKELEIAKRDVELQLGNQKTAYEHEIKLLGSTLEQQKLALLEMNKQKRELEVEKEMLRYQIEENKRREETIDNTTGNIPPYKTNFIQDLEKILNETTADAETALSIALSKEAIVVGGITLHEMQLLVREATERCRDIGLNYEFLQQRIIVEKDLEPVIRVRDKDRMLETLWRPMYFLDWVHRLRDYDNEDTIKELIDAELNWEAFETSEMPEDSLDISRISINLTPVKKQLNESLHNLSMNGSFLDTTVNQTTGSVLHRRYDDMNACLIQIEVAAKTLGKLCHQYESRETSGKVTKSLDEVRKIVSTLRSHLQSIHMNDDSIDTNPESSLHDTIIENSVNSKVNDDINVSGTQSKNNNECASPKKNLRPNGRTPFQDSPSRSVRFRDE